MLPTLLALLVVFATLALACLLFLAWRNDPDRWQRRLATAFKFVRAIVVLLGSYVAITAVLLISIPYAILYVTLKCIIGESAKVRVQFD